MEPPLQQPWAWLMSMSKNASLAAFGPLSPIPFQLFHVNACCISLYRQCWSMSLRSEPFSFYSFGCFEWFSSKELSTIFNIQATEVFLPLKFDIISLRGHSLCFLSYYWLQKLPFAVTFKENTLLHNMNQPAFWVLNKLVLFCHPKKERGRYTAPLVAFLFLCDPFLVFLWNYIIENFQQMHTMLITHYLF